MIRQKALHFSFLNLAHIQLFHIYTSKPQFILHDVTIWHFYIPLTPVLHHRIKCMLFVILYCYIRSTYFCTINLLATEAYIKIGSRLIIILHQLLIIKILRDNVRSRKFMDLNMQLKSSQLQSQAIDGSAHSKHYRTSTLYNYISYHLTLFRRNSSNNG